MKVLFLDFDGVFNSEQSKVFWENLKDQDAWEKDIKNFNGGMLEMFAKEYCPIALSNMEHLLRRNPEVKIVVSSSWRTSRTVQELKEVFKSPLISAAIFDKTESFSKVRGNEIQKWLDEHPEVTHYVIVDDEEIMLESQQEHYVKVSKLHGFQYGDFLWAESVLGKWSTK